MKILIRLPNWLGDMVMSIYFVREVKKIYPEAEISVIAKKGIESLLELFEPLQHKFVFSKNEYKGIRGLYKFGRMIKSTARFDLFFCLPDSFSSAFMGWVTGARMRIGYAKEGRSVLLTKSYLRNRTEHRVVQYLKLLDNYEGMASNYIPDLILTNNEIKKEGIIINVHSEAVSRRLPIDKAIAIINFLSGKTSLSITMIGSPAEQLYTGEIISGLQQPHRVISKAGRTTLPQLFDIFKKAQVMLSTDSGPAHLANACGLPTVVLFGAGDEKETRPFYKAVCKIIRLGKLPCEPCVSNTCIYGKPLCLIDLDTKYIVDSLLEMTAENNQ